MTRRRPAVVHRLPDAPARYSQAAEAQFRAVVEAALSSFQAEIASEPQFEDAFASVDADGDLNFEYRLNVPFGVSVAYAWEATKDDAGAAMPTNASILDGSHANYAVNDASADEIEIVAAKAPDAGDEIFLKVIPFSAAAATGRDGTEAEFHIVIGVSGTMIPSGTIIADKLTDQGRRFSTDMVFSASDNDTVAWTTSTINLANGDTFSITGANTGNMVALTYIYLDRTVSTTALQTTTNFANVASDDVILLCVANVAGDGSQKAFFIPGVGVFGLNEEQLSPLSVSATIIQTNAVTTPKLVTNAVVAAKITAGAVETAKIAALAVTAAEIAANTITAAKMNIASLSAISADIGTVTAGLLQNSAGTRFMDLDATGTQEFIKHDNFTLLADGTATFGGTVTATAFTGATATFDGSVEVKAGGGFVAAKIVTNAFEIYDSGSTKTASMGLSSTHATFIAHQGDVQLSSLAGHIVLSPSSTSNRIKFANVATAATVGASQGYIRVHINGTDRKIQYYAT